MLIRGTSKNYPINQKIENFEVVSQFKYLGLIIDSSLTLKP